MMELDPKYVDVIISRWQNYTGNQATHENGKTFTELSQERLNAEEETQTRETA